jgi:hypothetical protein
MREGEGDDADDSSTASISQNTITTTMHFYPSKSQVAAVIVKCAKIVILEISIPIL